MYDFYIFSLLLIYKSRGTFLYIFMSCTRAIIESLLFHFNLIFSRPEDGRLLVYLSEMLGKLSRLLYAELIFSTRSV